MKKEDHSLKIIDAHAHIFPDKIALKASEAIGDFYQIPMRYDGTVSTLLSLGEASHIDRFLVHSVATVPEQVQAINNFIAKTVSSDPEKFIGFATMHPDYPDIPGEVDRIMSLGLKGIKIHPDFQKFEIDSPQAYGIYEAIEGRLPILVHTGDYRYEYSKPKRMAAVLNRFPALDVIGAHFGGWSEWEKAADILGGKRIWVDTSSSMYSLTPERTRELIHLFGVDRVLFGTDYPMWDPADELELLGKVGLTEEELEKILHGNVERLLKL